MLISANSNTLNEHMNDRIGIQISFVKNQLILTSHINCFCRALKFYNIWVQGIFSIIVLLYIFFNHCSFVHLFFFVSQKTCPKCIFAFSRHLDASLKALRVSRYSMNIYIFCKNLFYKNHEAYVLKTSTENYLQKIKIGEIETKTIQFFRPIFERVKVPRFHNKIRN